MIRLHWWKGRPNFGDAMSPLICEHLSQRRTEWAPLEQSQLISVGSLLATHLFPQSLWDQFRGVVWGSGCMFPTHPPRIPPGQVMAVRGPLTATALGIPGMAVHGDPALLVREFMRGPSRPTHLLGIVPHWSDRSHPLFRSALVDHSDVLVIDPTEAPSRVVEKIASCHRILSSSLHGLVVADSFQIPSRWIRFETGREDAMGASRFKFEDYFAGWGRTDVTPLIPSPQMQLDDYVGSIECDRDFSLLDEFCTNLKSSFPYRA